MAAPLLGPLLARVRRDPRGTAIVETAFVLPVILLLLFGLIEMGRALQQQHTLTKSVRDAARYVARVPLDCPAGTDPDWGDIQAAARRLAATGQLSGGDPLVTGWTEASFTVADPVCESWSGQPVQRITVSAQVPYRDFGLLGLIGLGPITLGASHEQVHIGE